MSLASQINTFSPSTVLDAAFKNDQDASFRRHAIKTLIAGAGLSALAGAGMSGLGRLRDYLATSVSKPIKPMLRQSVVELPIVVKKDDEEEKRSSLKAAADQFAKVYEIKTADVNIFSDLLNRFTTAVGAGPNPRSALFKHFWPDKVWNNWDMPGYAPLGVALSIPSILASKRLTDKLFESRRKSERDSELQLAQEHFHKTLIGNDDDDNNHSYLPIKKSAHELTREQAFQQLFEKRASLGNLEGLYLATAAGLGILAAQRTYDYLNENSQAKLIEKVLRQREEEIFSQAPAPILVHPELLQKIKTPKDKTKIPIERIRRLATHKHEPFLSQPKRASNDNIGAAITQVNNRLQARRQYYQNLMAAQNQSGRSQQQRPALAQSSALSPPSSIGQLQIGGSNASPRPTS